jgi:hypothetical protein
MWKAVEGVVLVVLPCLGAGAIAWIVRRARLRAENEALIVSRLARICAQTGHE